MVTENTFFRFQVQRNSLNLFFVAVAVLVNVDFFVFSYSKSLLPLFKNILVFRNISCQKSLKYFFLF